MSDLILDDEALTNNLTDEAASPLLTWATTQAVDLDEVGLQELRRLVRQVADVTADATDGSVDEVGMVKR